MFLVLFLVFIFFDPQNIFTFLKPLRLAFFSGLFVFLSSATAIIKNFFKTSQSCLFVMFYLLALFSAFNSIEWDMSKGIIFFLLKCILLYFAIISIVNSSDLLKKFIWILIVFISLNIILTMLFAKLGIHGSRGEGWRLRSFFAGEGDSSNGFAMMMLSFVPFQFYSLNRQQSNAKNFFLIVAIFATMLGILRTRSRMGFVGLALIIIMILWDKKKQTKIVFCVLAAILIAIPFTHKRTWERFDTISSQVESTEDKALGGRMIHWKAAFQIIEEYPFFGTGINTFLKAQEDVFMYDSDADTQHVAHNAYLQVWSEMGIFAVGSFALLILLSIKDSWLIERKLKDYPQYYSIHIIAKSVRMGLIAFLLCLIMLSEQYSRILYLLIAIAVSVKNVYQSEIASNIVKKES